MKALIFTILLLFSTSFCKAQDISYLFKIPDSLYSIQNNIIRYADNKLFVIRLTYLLSSITGANFIPYLDQYNLSGDKIAQGLVDPDLPQAIQMFSQECFIKFGPNLLFTGDKEHGGDTLQNTFIQSIDFTGQPKWRIDFLDIDSFSTSGVFLPVNPNACIHGMLREAADNDTDAYLSLVRFDPLGQILWNKNVLLPNSGLGFYSRVSRAAYTEDRLIWFLSHVSFTNGPQSMILETDYSGEILDVYEYPDTYTLLSKGSGNKFYVAMGEQFPQNFGYCLSSKNETYAIQEWESCTPNNANNNVSLWAINIDEDGNLFQVGSVVNATNSYHEGFITKTDSEGNDLWSKRYVFPASSDLNTVIRSIDFLPNGRIATVGTHLNQEGFHQWLMILDENGCYQGDCDDVIELTDDVVATSEPLLPEAFKLYPNPAKEQVSILLEEWAGEAVEIQIYNYFGQLMEARSVAALTEEAQVFDLKQYSSGVYAVTIQTEDNKRMTKLFVVGKE